VLQRHLQFLTVDCIDWIEPEAAKSRHTPEQIAALVAQKERALAKLPEVSAPPKAYNV
jgi:hypothetical protein